MKIIYFVYSKIRIYRRTEKAKNSGIVSIFLFSFLCLAACENGSLRDTYQRKTKSAWDFEDDLLYLVTHSVSYSRVYTPFRCSGDGQLQSSFQTCYVPGAGNQIFDAATNNPINATNVSINTDLRCKCAGRDIVDGSSWYVYREEAAALGEMLSEASDAYLTQTYPQTLTGYPAGIKFVCMPSFCRKTNPTYQIIESVP